MAMYQILYWFDLPVQVKARDANGRFSRPLPNRFQEAIDKAAMAAGLTGSEEYTDGFRWSEAKELPGTAEEAVMAVGAELDATYTKIDWRELAARIT